MSIKEQRNVNFHNKLMESWGFSKKDEESKLLTEEVDAFMDLNVGWGGGSEVWPKDDTVEDGVDDEVSLEAHSADAEERKVNNKVEETIRKSIRSILKDIVK
jgi:hypothetical protein